MCGDGGLNMTDFNSKAKKIYGEYRCNLEKIYIK